MIPAADKGGVALGADWQQDLAMGVWVPCFGVGWMGGGCGGWFVCGLCFFAGEIFLAANSYKQLSAEFIMGRNVKKPKRTLIKSFSGDVLLWKRALVFSLV